MYENGKRPRSTADHADDGEDEGGKGRRRGELMVGRRRGKRRKGEEEEEEEGQNGASSYSSSSPHTRRTSLIAHRHTDRIRRQLHTDTRTASDANCSHQLHVVRDAYAVSRIADLSMLDGILDVLR